MPPPHLRRLNALTTTFTKPPSFAGTTPRTFLKMFHLSRRHILNHFSAQDTAASVFNTALSDQLLSTSSSSVLSA